MSLEIAPAAGTGLLPTCTPSLMPFHISYTGFAPISRYFRPRPALPSPPTLSVHSSSSATLVASASSASILSETKSSFTTTTSVGSLVCENACGEDALLSKTTSSTKVAKVMSQVEQVAATELLVDTTMGADSETQPALGAVPHTPALRHVRRFLAAFRGRQLYGQAMDIPIGYGGLVLRAPTDPRGKGKEDAKASSKPLSQRAKPKSKTRRLKRTAVDDPADGPEGRNDGDRCSDSDADPPPLTRKLIPSSTFTSFMLWTQDRPLDEGRDEYARALVEWTHLATEIHSYDE